jgi:hypothetical protein
MNRRFGRETWSILVPNGWTASHDTACATLVGSPAIGALQLSAAFKETPVLDEDLEDFAAEHLQAGATATRVVAGGLSGVRDRLWRWAAVLAAVVLPSRASGTICDLQLLPSRPRA